MLPLSNDLHCYCISFARREANNRFWGKLDIVHAGFLAPLVKARGFGMTPLRGKGKRTHY